MRVLHHGADLAKPAEITALVEAALAEFGGVDILVNNAVVRHFAPIEDFKPEDWDRALAVNLSSAFHTTRLILPGMRQRDFGRIVNIASIFGLRAVVNRVDYVTTKTALIGFTRAVALETAAPEHHLQRDLPRLVADAGDRAAPRRFHGEGEAAARRGDQGLHGLAPAVGPVRGARAGGRPGRLPVRAGRRRHDGLCHFHRRRLERERSLSSNKRGDDQ